MKNLSIAVLRLYDFRLLLLTRMCGIMALQAQAVIVGWQVYSLTKDVFLLGLIGLVEAVPALCCALVSGYVVDISRPYRVLFYCMFGLVINTIMLFLIGGGIIAPPGGDIVPWLFAGVFLSGIARSFLSPSAFSLIHKIVPRNELSSAMAWISGGAQSMAILGPAIAGLSYGGYGPRGAWMIPAFLMACSFFICIFIRDSRQARNSELREPAIKSIRAGWSFIIHHPVLLSAMTLDMFAVLFGGAVAMLPAYADQILHVGSQGLGALRAAPALGAVITALYLALRPMPVITATRLLWMVAGFGVCMIGFGLSTIFWLSMVLLVISGAFDCVSMVMRLTLVQLLAPDAMRGRIAAVNSMFIISSNEIGAFESGTAARLMGLVPSVVFGGVMTLIVTITIAIASPRFRKTVIDTRET